MADGVEAAGKNATGFVENLSELSYTPVKEDYGKTISLRIYKTKYATTTSSTVFSVVLTGGVVKAYDITALLSKNTSGKALTFTENVELSASVISTFFCVSALTSTSSLTSLLPKLCTVPV